MWRLTFTHNGVSKKKKIKSCTWTVSLTHGLLPCLRSRLSLARPSCLDSSSSGCTWWSRASRWEAGVCTRGSSSPACRRWTTHSRRCCNSSWCMHTACVCSRPWLGQSGPRTPCLWQSSSALSFHADWPPNLLQFSIKMKLMFYLTTHSTHFIYAHMTSDIW